MSGTANRRRKGVQSSCTQIGALWVLTALTAVISLFFSSGYLFTNSYVKSQTLRVVMRVGATDQTMSATHTSKIQLQIVNITHQAILNGSLAQMDPGLHTAHAYQNHSVTYRDHYPLEELRPNTCRLTHRSKQKDVDTMHIPFIGTSAIRDSQMLLMRLYYSSRDFPVKYFILVVAMEVLTSHTALGYEVRHLLEYGYNVLLLTCEEHPSAAEGWNAVFQQLPEEAWGVYAATDTAWEPGSLQKLAAHFWRTSIDEKLDVGLMKWVNMPDNNDGAFNAFAMTRDAISRYGLFDENLYPAYFEDRDFNLRVARMQPPLNVKHLSDVIMVHGSPTVDGYRSGIGLPGDPQDPKTQHMNALAGTRFLVNANYIYRKWGCEGEKHQTFAPWSSCMYKTPFNRSVPVWYWHTSKQQRLHDLDLKVVRDSKPHLARISSNHVVFYFPDTYVNWAGYEENSGMCSLSGKLGVVQKLYNNANSTKCV